MNRAQNYNRCPNFQTGKIYLINSMKNNSFIKYKNCKLGDKLGSDYDYE